MNDIQMYIEQFEVLILDHPNSILIINIKLNNIK